MKKRQKVIPVLVVFAALLLFLSFGLYLSDEHISGFTGIWAIMNLTYDKTYVKLADEPMQLLIRQDDAKGDFENSYFDDWADLGHPARGFGSKNGCKYEYFFRSFTRNYFIVTFEEIVPA